MAIRAHSTRASIGVKELIELGDSEAALKFCWVSHKALPAVAVHGCGHGLSRLSIVVVLVEVVDRKLGEVVTFVVCDVRDIQSV